MNISVYLRRFALLRDFCSKPICPPATPICPPTTTSTPPAHICPPPKPICPPIQQLCEPDPEPSCSDPCADTECDYDDSVESHNFSEITCRMLTDDRPEPLGPGASKCGDYKNTEYYSYHKYSYDNGQMDVLPKRAHEQPDAKRKP